MDYYKINGKNTYLGSYNTEIEAAEVYNKKCIEYSTPHLMNDLSDAQKGHWRPSPPKH